MGCCSLTGKSPVDIYRAIRCVSLHGLAAALAAGRFLLLTTLHAGLFVMLALTYLSQIAGTSTLALETLQSALQGFIFSNADLRHVLTPPSIEGLLTDGT